MRCFVFAFALERERQGRGRERVLSRLRTHCVALCGAGSHDTEIMT